MYLQLQSQFVQMSSVNPYAQCAGLGNPVSQNNCVRKFSDQKYEIKRTLKNLEEWIDSNCFN